MFKAIRRDTIEVIIVKVACNCKQAMKIIQVRRMESQLSIVSRDIYDFPNPERRALIKS